MKRPLFVLWIGLVLGELCGQIMNLSGVLIPASLFLILRDRHCLIRLLQSGKGDVSWICRKSQKPFFILYLLFLLMMISGVFSWNIESYTLKKMEKFQEVNAGEETELCGEIYARKENAKGYVTYWITHLKTKDGKRSFSNGVSIIGKCEKDTSFYPGEEVVFTSKLEKLKERRNPGAFDEKNYYLSNGIFLTGFFTSIYRNPSSPKKLFSLKKWSYPVKVRIEQYYKNI